MNDESDIDPESRALFRDAVTGSRRLSHDKIKPYRKRLKPTPNQRLRDNAEVMSASLAPVSWEMEDIEQGDELLFARDGVQKRVLQKLRRGQYRIEAELDLHRLTSEQAYDALTQFIQQCQARHIRCIRIIHGKGLSSRNQMPVLKHRINTWLRQWKNILAFCSARRCDGGTGAIYVLLQRT